MFPLPVLVHAKAINDGGKQPVGSHRKPLQVRLSILTQPKRPSGCRGYTPEATAQLHGGVGGEKVVGEGQMTCPKTA